MNDPIERQEAIDALGERPIVWSNDDEYALGERNQYDTDRLAIETVPSAQSEQRWIPCSERLPEEKEKSYWVCLKTGGQCQCRWTNDMYGFGANKWSKWGWHVMDKPQFSEIVAWMPLPEPYREEGEQE